VPDFVLFMNEGIFVILKFIFIIMSECWFMPKKQLFIYIMDFTPKKSYFFQILGGRRVYPPPPPPPGSTPVFTRELLFQWASTMKYN
jgi:hypothetical protein